jgi:hypothetical protein|tara:strand:- start:7660 stop:7848 length:189 start_codon:yes stop_codon:yes gene_type:complete
MAEIDTVDLNPEQRLMALEHRLRKLEDLVTFARRAIWVLLGMGGTNFMDMIRDHWQELLGGG